MTDRPACTLRGLPNTRRTPFDLLFIEIEWVSSVRDKQSVLADTHVDASIVIAFLDSVACVLEQLDDFATLVIASDCPFGLS
ncbi:hypothetical protein DU504_17525 [Haloplanus salinus]|uniref:Uncharacterized protein n=1 Tax=Haloplanus salinus TaxID=1126245 RepID=A0A368N251_9EURY|nr:hypothetical protein DU504_17525 [Haloplanus salinus]